MSDVVAPSPGLATTGNIVEPKKRKHRAVKPSTIAARQALKEKTLAERAKALKERKTPTYRLILKVDEETYAAVVALGERASLVVEDAAIRALREGLRKYEELAINPMPFTSTEFHTIPLGDIGIVSFEDNPNPYRTQQQVDEEMEARKRLVKSIGLQTNAK